MGRRVLVTGAARSTGRRLVAALAEEPEVEQVVAVDELEPEEPFPAKVEHLGVDLRSPALVRTVQSAGIDTCVHLGVTAEPRAAGGRASMKERNVLGTMQLLAAAYHSPDLRRLVLKSTTAVYGAAAGDPAVWTESMSHETPRHGFGKDAIEVEDYVRSFDRRRPDVAVTVLRLANQVGPTVDNPLTRYFELPVCPTVLGFDPRLQFLHEEDTAEVLLRATLGPADAGHLQHRRGRGGAAQPGHPHRRQAAPAHPRAAGRAGRRAGREDGRLLPRTGPVPPVRAGGRHLGGGRAAGVHPQVDVAARVRGLRRHPVAQAGHRGAGAPARARGAGPAAPRRQRVGR